MQTALEISGHVQQARKLIAPRIEVLNMLCVSMGVMKQVGDVVWQVCVDVCLALWPIVTLVTVSGSLF